eukprot:12767-Heterococcus_DN1.PRE.1
MARQIPQDQRIIALHILHYCMRAALAITIALRYTAAAKVKKRMPCLNYEAAKRTVTGVRAQNRHNAVVLCDKPAATTALQIAAFDHTTTSVERRAAVASQKSSSSSVRALKWTLARSYYQASLAAACRF